jgi:glycosyltransferase involved in cell wall biosynthesis
MAFSWYDYKKYQQYIDAFFVLSQFQREKLKSYIDSDKMWLKPNPIDQPGPLTPHDQKKNYLFVGRLESAKGINELLATWDTLPAQFHLDIIGDGPDRAKLQTQYTKANIQFLGQLPNETVLKKMSAAKYLMHTSLAYETFGLTMIEALARGTPVIGFNIGTRPELVHSGQNGFLTTPDQLRVTIMQSHDYPDYATLSQNAFESAQSFYTPQVLEQQIQYYQQWMCH